MGATKALEFDREALIAAHGGRGEHLGKILRSYLREAPRMLAALSSAVAQKDAEQIELAAHHVAGELLCLHARPAAAVARRIESAAAAGRVQVMPRLLKVLEVSSKELLVALVPLAISLERDELLRGHDKPEEPEVVYVCEDLVPSGDDGAAANLEPTAAAAEATSAPSSGEFEINFSAFEP